MTRRKVKWKNVFLCLIFNVFLITLGISIYQSIRWLKESDDINKQIDKIDEIVTIVEVDDTENTEIIEQPQVEEVPKTNPYWDYIKMSLIDVDFSELKQMNSSTVGWIQVNGTNINYPFVQTYDNSYYLTHSFDKSYNNAGWVFLDYRNNISDLNRNTILYAHGRLDNTMFGSLKNILTSGWLDNANNYVVKLSTEKENTLWQVFSVYRIPTTNDYIRVNFLDNKDFLDFANVLLSRSVYNFNTIINEGDKILTLSTCYNKTDKVVLHAKLIKKEAK